MDTKVISIIGIDGSGKSSISNLLLNTPEFSMFKFSVITCPDYHRMPGNPYEKLSVALHNLNVLADKYKHGELKAAALYLQMTVFGPVEDFVKGQYAPDFIITERHAIIDTLVYGIFYSKIANLKTDNSALNAQILAELEEQNKTQLEEIYSWIESENTRLNRNIGLWEIPAEVSKLFQLGTGELINAFREHYRTDLPNVIIFIDVDVDVALSRLNNTGATLEFHEQKSVLENFKSAYLELFRMINLMCPQINIITLKQDGSETPSETVQLILKNLQGIEQ